MQDLHNRDVSIQFYNHRYEKGYMEEWDEGKMNKVREAIKMLQLPATGRALDFGCGNGVFTNLLKECLPSWDIYGVEISKVAVANASKKFPSCKFFTAEKGDQFKNQFDFLFSHHVIEHVTDLNETFHIINGFLKPRAFQLHILPCGNEGSFEYNICLLKKNGIERDKENRFFFEEPGHLRRLTTDEFVNLEATLGFRLQRELYTNQYYGAVNWITKSSPRFVKMLTSPHDAIDESSKQELLNHRKKLLPLTYLQFPYSKYWAIRSRWRKSLTDYLKLVVLFIPKIISKKFYDKLEKESYKEWNSHKFEKNGSEMFLFFER